MLELKSTLKKPVYVYKNAQQQSNQAAIAYAFSKRFRLQYLGTRLMSVTLGL